MATPAKNMPHPFDSLVSSDTPQAPNCKQFLQSLSGFGVLVGDFYLLLGEARKQVALPLDVRRGPMKQCYMNAGMLATNNAKYTYCEGYALRTGLFPVHHAWCLDENGGVVDPTWPVEAGNEFYGVALKTEFLLLSSLKTGVWGILSERLPDSVVQEPPDSYLHEHWRPEPERLEAFWTKLQATLAQKT